jgi:multiple sugar transport system ATP-binding protein
MVFQHHALYPHMTVRENMAFGLVNAGVPKNEITQRIAQAADILEIGNQLDNQPGQMSGGQRQREAIGRAIVKQPRLLLPGEPLSNLDGACATARRWSSRNYVTASMRR